MTRAERFEMGFIVALGIGIGSMSSHAMHWPWWVAIPLSVIAAGACYKPREILERLRSQCAPWTGPGLGNAVLMGLYWFLYVLTGAIVAIALPAFIFAGIMLENGSELIAKDPIGMLTLSLTLGFFGGGGMLAIGIPFAKETRRTQCRPGRYKEVSWAMPISRRMPTWLLPSNKWFHRGWKTSLLTRMGCVTWKIPVAQLVGIYAFVIILTDMMLTVGIAAATTRRVAVMTCAFIGATVNTVLGWHQIIDPGIGIFAGMVVGGCAGYFWHPLAHSLKKSKWDRSNSLALAA